MLDFQEGIHYTSQVQDFLHQQYQFMAFELMSDDSLP